MTTAIFAIVLVTAPEKFICSSERFGYLGTVSVYSTLADARAGKNARFTAIAFPPRDGSIYMARNMGGEWSEFNAILTNWYSTTNPDPEKKGHGNPNNQNTGFFQMYDNNADNWQNQKSTWNKTKTAFTLTTKGKNASYPSVDNPGEYARLWNAGYTTGGGEGTKGTYIEYEVSFTATGLTGADDDADGFIENTANATGYSGFYKAIFKNESTRSPESNGYYVVHLTFNNTSWAAGQGLTEVDHFGSSNVAK
jgi:hypothetical protein